MKRIIIFLILLALSFFNFNCGGGGAGSSDSPKGENPKIPSIVQLLPSHYIAQTNSYITIHTKVLDGNGVGVSNVMVNFTNLSPVGVLSSISARTNNEGIATVNVGSNTPGFSTIQAEVNTGVAIVRDYKTVFFSPTNTAQLTPYLDLYVDGDGDLLFNEENDFILFQNENDNSVMIMAKVYNVASYIAGSVVTFGSDRPYKIGADPDARCSDGSDTCDVIFPAGNEAITNSRGEASVPVIVVPSTLMPIPTTLNIYAAADIGAFNMITLFLRPVTISRVSVSANPNIIESGGSSEISAIVTTTAGTPAPDGTTVNFRILSGIGGWIDPFGQTTSGVATATYTAPTLPEGGSDQSDQSDQLVTIEAAVGSKKGTVTITVKAPPAEEGYRVSVSANPNIIESGGSSKISAIVTTTAGTLAPDGTTVNFRILSGIGGGIDPLFGQTTSGVATATYTAPTLPEGGSDQLVTIEAAVGSKKGKGTVTITVKAPPG